MHVALAHAIGRCGTQLEHDDVMKLKECGSRLEITWKSSDACRRSAKEFELAWIRWGGGFKCTHWFGNEWIKMQMDCDGRLLMKVKRGRPQAALRLSRKASASCPSDASHERAVWPKFGPRGQA